MPKEYSYFVYIMSSISGVFYIGVTNNLLRRVEEHKSGKIKGFTCKYKFDRIVYYEHFTDVGYAIIREKQIKNWTRRKKIKLIERENSYWNDLYDKLLK